MIYKKSNLNLLYLYYRTSGWARNIYELSILHKMLKPSQDPTHMYYVLYKVWYWINHLPMDIEYVDI